ncbi:MAG TPA: DinB family protein, partial [Candidatus Eisenbacteria bacterium]|nr:DinB family protein [Candidatus Eisenbacteria bacterium]
MPLTRSERERLIQQYADGPARLEGALAAVPTAARQWRPAPGEWSVHEVACHCADSEVNGAARIRYVVCEPQPVVLAYDESVWAVTLDYHGHPLEPALATVRAVRAHTTALLRRLPEFAWSREGRHTGSGRYTA